MECIQCLVTTVTSGSCQGICHGLSGQPPSLSPMRFPGRMVTLLSSSHSPVLSAQLWGSEPDRPTDKHLYLPAFWTHPLRPSIPSASCCGATWNGHALGPPCRWTTHAQGSVFLDTRDIRYCRTCPVWPGLHQTAEHCTMTEPGKRRSGAMYQILFHVSGRCRAPTNDTHWHCWDSCMTLYTRFSYSLSQVNWITISLRSLTDTFELILAETLFVGLLESNHFL